MLVQSLRLKSWRVWPEVAYETNWISAVIFFFFYKKVRTFRTHCTSSICPGLNTSAWERYVDFFVFCVSVFRSAWSIRSFSVFDLTFSLILDSASKNAKAWYRQCFDSWPPNPCVPSGGPWCVSFEVSWFMDTCYTPRYHSDAKFL